MVDKEYPETNVISEGVSNHKPPQTIETLYKEVEGLRATNKEQDIELQKLRANQKNINDRLQAQERYTRKDGLLVVNPPFKARTSKDVPYDTQLFKNFLGISYREIA